MDVGLRECVHYVLILRLLSSHFCFYLYLIEPSRIQAKLPFYPLAISPLTMPLPLFWFLNPYWIDFHLSIIYVSHILDFYLLSTLSNYISKSNWLYYYCFWYHMVFYFNNKPFLFIIYPNKIYLYHSYCTNI